MNGPWSGVFILFDDAFRVGEHIQGGNYKGTGLVQATKPRIDCGDQANRADPSEPS